MAYVKYTWQNFPNVTTPISKANLDHLETQYEEFTKLYDAHSILMAILDDTPVVLPIVASGIVGRTAASNIKSLSAAEVKTIIGWTAAKLLRGAGAGVAPTEIDTIATGNYVGNQTARQVTVGFKCSMVVILTTDGDDGDELGILIPNITIRIVLASQDQTAMGWLHAADGIGLSVSASFNKTGSTYYYWAISEL